MKSNIPLLFYLDSSGQGIPYVASLIATHVIFMIGILFVANAARSEIKEAQEDEVDQEMADQPDFHNR